MADAFEASSKLFRGFLSGVQRPRHHLDGLLDRIERTDSKLHAFVAVYAEAVQLMNPRYEERDAAMHLVGDLALVPSEGNDDVIVYTA